MKAEPRGFVADPTARPAVEDDNPEWTEADFARATSIFEIPELAEFAAFIDSGGRPRLPSKVRKRRVTLRLDPEVLAHFRDTGPGWQTRMNAALRAAAGFCGPCAAAPDPNKI